MPCHCGRVMSLTWLIGCAFSWLSQYSVQQAASRWCYVMQPVGHVVMGCLPHLHYVGDPLVRCHVVWDSMIGDQALLSP